MAETLASFSLATAGFLLVRLPSGGVERSPGAAGGECKAPCWVLKEQLRLSFRAFEAGVSSSRRQAWLGLAYRRRIVGFGVGRIGLWVGRLLRIAQWTRASLWSSCQGRTVDALAPGADEGRGRPR